MPSFNNIDSLVNYLRKKASSTVKNEVAVAVIQAMQDEIKETVYQAFEPVMYERSYYDDGLLDPDNIEIQVVSENMISVENIRSDGNRNVAQIVETGWGYTYPVSIRDRPFTMNTRIKLQNSNILKRATKNGFNRQGIDIR